MSTILILGAAQGASPVVGGQTLWYATRAAGLVTLLLLTGSVVLGIATRLEVGGRRLPAFVTGALHRNVSFMALTMLVIHVVTIMVDGYAPVRWIDTLVPFVSRYHGWGLGLGVVASDLFLVLIVNSAFRSKLPFPLWRAIHWAAYVSWPSAIWHGLVIGTDRHTPWMIALNVACIAVVAGAATARVISAARNPGRHAAVPAPDPLERLRELTAGSRP